MVTISAATCRDSASPRWHPQVIYRRSGLHGALAHVFPELPRKMPCCFGCAVLISVLRNLATLRGAEFHVRASGLLRDFLPDPRLFASAIGQQRTPGIRKPLRASCTVPYVEVPSFWRLIFVVACEKFSPRRRPGYRRNFFNDELRKISRSTVP